MSYIDSEFHRDKAKSLLADAELIHDEAAVQRALDKVARASRARTVAMSNHLRW